MALAHWQMEVQARDTLEMAAGVKSSLSMYGCILVMTASGMLSCGYGREKKNATNNSSEFHTPANTCNHIGRVFLYSVYIHACEGRLLTWHYMIM